MCASGVSYYIVVLVSIEMVSKSNTESLSMF